jgi:hypothetical protein
MTTAFRTRVVLSPEKSARLLLSGLNHKDNLAAYLECTVHRGKFLEHIRSMIKWVSKNLVTLPKSQTNSPQHSSTAGPKHFIKTK